GEPRGRRSIRRAVAERARRAGGDRSCSDARRRRPRAWRGRGASPRRAPRAARARVQNPRARAAAERSVETQDRPRHLTAPRASRLDATAAPRAPAPVARASRTSYRRSMRALLPFVLGAWLCASAALADTPPPRVFLIGDSTVASGSGYGDALCARFQPEVACTNLARGGKSSRTYRDDAAWSALLEQLVARS